MTPDLQQVYRYFARHRNEWRDVRATLVAHNSLLVIAASWTIWFSMMAHYSYRLDLVAVLVGLLVISVLAFTQARHRPLAAAWTVVTAVYLVIAVAYAWFAIPLAGFAFVIPVMMAGFLLHPVASLLMTLLSVGVLFLLAPPAEPNGWVTPAALTLFVGLLDTVSGLGLTRELNLVWDYTAQEAARADEARQQRAEVTRLNRALTLANSLLERSNNELASARREAEEARHLKEQFATQVSHELRTPLNIILGFLEVMQRYPEVYGEVQWTPPLRQDIAEIQASARYLSDLVDDILDLARIQALKMPVRREMSDLAEVISEVQGLAEQLVRGRPIRLVVRVEPLPQLFIDRARIRQVLLNLLANASRFTEQGEIGITVVEQAGEEVVVSVSDTGVGMSAEQLAHLFTEFYQVSSEPALLTAAPLPARSSPVQRGKGLGLVIAKQFVELHGGRIWAESQAGLGSTFRFSLPLISKEISNLGRPEPVGPKATDRPYSLLVVDPQGAAYLSRRLEGYEIIAAESPDRMREIVNTRHPDAVLYDMPLAVGTASDPPAELLTYGVPVLQCLLPFRSWSLDNRLFDGWLDDWLVKPISTAQIVELLDRHASAGKILVVDDDPSFIQFVRRVIEATQGQGAQREVVQAFDGATAVELAKQDFPDLILLDIGLPDADGRTVARALRAVQPGPIPIIVLSAQTPDEEHPPVQPASFRVTRQAPFSEEELLALITHSLSTIRPHYAGPQPDREPEEAPSVTPAS